MASARALAAGRVEHRLQKKCFLQKIGRGSCQSKGVEFVKDRGLGLMAVHDPPEELVSDRGRCIAD